MQGGALALSRGGLVLVRCTMLTLAAIAVEIERPDHGDCHLCALAVSRGGLVPCAVRHAILSSPWFLRPSLEKLYIAYLCFSVKLYYTLLAPCA